MPIYAYRCTSCGHAQDVLQRISDPLLNVCPACGASTYVKQVTAAGFQLKGSGWYVTDFRDNASKKPADGGAAAKSEGGEKTSAGDAPAKADGDGGAGKGASAKGDAAPAASAPAAAPAPAAGSSASSAPAAPASGKTAT
jgi:putative FmdB family regulatory protein